MTNWVCYETLQKIAGKRLLFPTKIDACNNAQKDQLNDCLYAKGE